MKQSWEYNLNILVENLPRNLPENAKDVPKKIAKANALVLKWCDETDNNAKKTSDAVNSDTLAQARKELSDVHKILLKASELLVVDDRELSRELRKAYEKNLQLMGGIDTNLPEIKDLSIKLLQAIKR